eukprot:4897771-Pleurochrysis_carterae.AAC.1
MKQTLDSYFEGGTRAIAKSTEEEEPTEEEEEEPQKKKQKKKTAPTIGNTTKRSITKHDKQFFIDKFHECGIGSIHTQNALLQKYLNAENTTYFFDFEAISSHNEPSHIPYMCCWQLDEEHTRTEYASGEDCAKKFLDVLCERHGVIYEDEATTCIPTITLYAHNITYDLSFIFKHLRRVEFIERGSSLVCGTA